MTAEPTTEQTGQKCVAEGEAEADKSVQKWNCAPRKIIPKSNATTRTRLALLRICLIRRSLGRIGCSVKHDGPSRPSRFLNGNYFSYPWGMTSGR